MPSVARRLLGEEQDELVVVVVEEEEVVMVVVAERGGAIKSSRRNDEAHGEAEENPRKLNWGKKKKTQEELFTECWGGGGEGEDQS